MLVSQGTKWSRNLKSGLLGTPYQGTYFTEWEVQEKQWRRMLTSWLTGQLILKYIIHTIQYHLPRMLVLPTVNWFFQYWLTIPSPTDRQIYSQLNEGSSSQMAVDCLVNANQEALYPLCPLSAPKVICSRESGEWNPGEGLMLHPAPSVMEWWQLCHHYHRPAFTYCVAYFSAMSIGPMASLLYDVTGWSLYLD